VTRQTGNHVVDETKNNVNPQPEKGRLRAITSAPERPAPVPTEFVMGFAMLDFKRVGVLAIHCQLDFHVYIEFIFGVRFLASLIND